MAPKPRISLLLPLGLTLLAVGLLSFVQITDYDTWLHVGQGRYILTHGQIPRAEFTSHTVPGTPMCAHEWLFDLLSGLLFQLFGAAGLQVVNLLVVLAGYGLFFLLAHRLGTAPWLAAALTVLAANDSFHRLPLRPHVFSFLALGAMIWLLLRPMPEWRRSVLLFCLAAVWLNLHSGVIFGLFLTFTFSLWVLGQELVQTRRAGGRLGARRIAAGLAPFWATLLGSLASPLGVSAVLYPLRLVASGSNVTVGPEEWQPTPFSPYFAFFWCSLVLLPLAIFFRRRQREGALLPFLVAIAAGAVAYRREVLLFLPVAMLFIGPFLSDLARRLTERRRAWRWVLAGLLLVAVAVPVARTYREREYLYRFGWGINPYAVPVDLPAFLERHGLAGRFYNSYSIGAFLGYWTWPQSTIFMDGRIEEFAPVYRNLGQHLHGLDTLFTKIYPVDLAAVCYPPREQQPVVEYFRSRPDWALVYFDDVCLLFVRREVLERAGPVPTYQVIGRVEPEDPRAVAVAPAALAELDRAGRDAPHSARVRYLKGLWLLAAGRPAEAGAELEAARFRYRRFADYHLAVARASLLAGDAQAALRAADLAVRYGRARADTWLARAGVKAVAGDRRGALADARRAQALLQATDDPAPVQHFLQALEAAPGGDGR